MSKATTRQALTEAEARELIGHSVKKRSGKPFKSQRRVNTVRDVVTHPQKPDHAAAFLFVEDDSIVAVEMCERI